MTNSLNPTSSESDFLAPREVADWLGVPLRTIYGWRHRGLGPRGATFGRHVRYRRADVEAWIAEQYASDRHAAPAS